MSDCELVEDLSMTDMETDIWRRENREYQSIKDIRLTILASKLVFAIAVPCHTNILDEIELTTKTAVHRGEGDI